MGHRHKAREVVLRCLYAYDSIGQDLREIEETILTKDKLSADAFPFAETLFRKVIANLAELDSLIVAQSQNWKLERLAMVDKNILRMAICELLYFPDIPAEVSIDEGVELAKRYSTAESAGFVNGILDAVYRQLSEQQD
jgi:N utilization substance protein B